jgi:hypothetical protein
MLAAGCERWYEFKARAVHPTGSHDEREAISPLRWRTLDDMTMRRLTAETERDYIRSTPELGEFLAPPGRPDSLERRRVERPRAQHRGIFLNSNVRANPNQLRFIPFYGLLTMLS